MLYRMVRAEDRHQVAMLIKKYQGEADMGMIPNNLDTQLENTETGAGPLDAGVYTGTVISAKIEEGFKPWVDVQLTVKFAVNDSSSVAFYDLEVAPLTGKDGTVSDGKLKFLKWQLEALGYNGKLSELEYNTDGLLNAQVEFEQKVETSDRINEKSGQNYINREVTLIKNVLPGVGGNTGSASMEEVPDSDLVI